MKKHLFIALFVFVSSPVFSQVPNGSFETWSNNGLYTEPSSWSTSNGIYFLLDQLAGMFEEATYHHPSTVIRDASPAMGSFAMTVRNVEGTVDGEKSDTATGFAALGEISFDGNTDQSGLPFTQRPVALTGSYKFIQGAPANSATEDTAYITAGVTRWNDELKEREIVGFGELEIFTQQSSYATFTLNFNYESGATPDTLVVFIASSITEKNFPTTSLTVDGLAFTGLTGIKMPFAHTKPVIAYPNPAINNIQLDDLPEGTTHILVKDISGKTIRKIETENKDRIGFLVSDIPSGLYFYSAENESGNVLYAGKFEVRN